MGVPDSGTITLLWPWVVFPAAQPSAPYDDGTQVASDYAEKSQFAQIAGFRPQCPLVCPTHPWAQSTNSDWNMGVANHMT